MEHYKNLIMGIFVFLFVIQLQNPIWIEDKNKRTTSKDRITTTKFGHTNNYIIIWESEAVADDLLPLRIPYSNIKVMYEVKGL